MRNMAFNNVQQLSITNLSDGSGFRSAKKLLVSIYKNDAICTMIPALSSSLNIDDRFLANDW
jgi:hypothetical protein